MDWYIVILLFFVLLIISIFFGFPVAFGFFLVNSIVAIIFIGFDSGIPTLINSAFESLAKFTLTPVPLFILMGTILFHTGLINILLDGISKLLGRVPARLSILSIGTGTVLSAMSGSATADAAMLSSTLATEMQKRGYHLRMIVGPITTAGVLAVIIPPSTLAILLGSTARISVGDILLAGIVPGLMIAFALLIYYLMLGYLKPDLAPNNDFKVYGLKDRMKALFLHVLPISSLIFFVLGLIFSGNVTPTESAATGVAGAILLSIIFKKFNIKSMTKAFIETVRVGSMILFIIAASAGFSQILAYTGATRELVNFVISFDMLPIITVIIMLLIILVLGTFMEAISIMMITTPLYFPVIDALGYDPIWFGILMLICLGLANITPPFGLLLFIIKGALPSNVPIKSIYLSVVAPVLIYIGIIIILMIFPNLVTWIPNLGG